MVTNSLGLVNTLWHPWGRIPLHDEDSTMPTISQLPRHAIPDRVMCELARKTMEAHFRTLFSRGKNRGAETPEQFYGFRPEDVDEMHFHKQGFGEGV
jgi:hypothetical protein